jgi:hypothetical protein
LPAEQAGIGIPRYIPGTKFLTVQAQNIGTLEMTSGKRTNAIVT